MVVNFTEYLFTFQKVCIVFNLNTIVFCFKCGNALNETVMEEELKQILVTVTRTNSPAEFQVELSQDTQSQKQDNRNAQNKTQPTSHTHRTESLTRGFFAINNANQQIIRLKKTTQFH